MQIIVERIFTCFISSGLLVRIRIIDNPAIQGQVTNRRTVRQLLIIIPISIIVS
jgi:hypothetical protein